MQPLPFVRGFAILTKRGPRPPAGFRPMELELIRAWLSLTTDAWPPDPYTLLGLAPGDTDRARIEQHVQERLERVRQFQLAHPEAATEAMNRLAQAFVCLTDSRAKPAPEPALLTDPVVSQQEKPPAPALGTTQLDWRETPPPSRILPTAEETSTLHDAATAETPPVPPPPAEPHDGAYRLPARRGLATKRALLDHVLLVRQMREAWSGAGRYLSRSTRPLTKPAEATDLLTHMGRIRALLEPLDGLLGQAGQPGYLVAALARQPLIVPTLQTLLPSQRAALARDWQSGLERLKDHLVYLRTELRANRRRSGLEQGVRALLVLLRDRPGLLLFALGVVALNLVPTFRHLWREQIVILLGFAAFQLFLWWDARASTRRLRAAGTRRPRTNRPKSVSTSAL